jgi:hypothetical protein
MVDFEQCMTNKIKLNCFWLYDSASGTTGKCRTKGDESLGCGDAKTISQCALVVENENGMKTKCFWLYDSASETTGDCRAKNDDELACENAKTQFQCTWGEVAKFGINCMWLEGNVVGKTYIEARCMKKVCVTFHLCVVWCWLCGIGCGCVDL